jgi:hypothetical protein
MLRDTSGGSRATHNLLMLKRTGTSRAGLESARLERVVEDPPQATPLVVPWPPWPLLRFLLRTYHRLPPFRVKRRARTVREKPREVTATEQLPATSDW